MSDYLKNLAARTLGSAPTVHPRLASRFEPVSLAAAPHAFDAAPFDAAHLDIEDGERRQRLSATAPHADSHRDEGTRATDSATVAADSRRFFDATRARVEADQQFPAPSRQTPRPQTHAHASPHAPGRVPEQPASQTTPAPAPAIPFTTTDDVRARLQSEADGARRASRQDESALERNIRRIVAGEFVERGREAATADSDRHPATERRHTPPVAVAPSSNAPAPSHAARREPSHSFQPSTPVIRVHIGRIEVRAVTAPSPASSPQHQRDSGRAPALSSSDPSRSLREYLSKRSGGRR